MKKKTNKKYAINGRFLLHRVTGVERYAREIIKELDTIIKPGEMQLLIPPEIENPPSYKNIEVKKIGKLHNRLWEHLSLSYYIIKNRMVCINFCNVAPFFSPGIVCIHDLKIKAHPEFFSKKFIAWYEILLKNECKRAKKIITVSNFSKKEIIKYYSVPKEKIIVAPSAWTHFEKVDENSEILQKYSLEKNNYFFSLSSLEPNKNFKWIAEVANRNKKSQFVIAGSINKEIFLEGLGFECPSNMRLLGYVSDADAKGLMRNCKSFIFPTIYEGFGLPPLEAMSLGIKSLVSDTETMREIYGNSVAYINPQKYNYDLDALLKKIDLGTFEKVLDKYSWKKSANIVWSHLGSPY